MSLIRKFSGILAACSVLALGVWTVGCADKADTAPAQQPVGQSDDDAPDHDLAGESRDQEMDDDYTDGDDFGADGPGLSFPEAGSGLAPGFDVPDVD